MSLDRLPPTLPVGYVEKRFINTILAIREKLVDSDADWSIGGDVADAIRGVDIKPEYLEISTDKEGAGKIREAMNEYNPTELKIVEQKLPRDAVVNGSNFPVHTRSSFFEFTIDKTSVKVHGDLQFKVGDREWGDVLEFIPELVYVVGVRISIVPLLVRSNLYRSLGWTDRVVAIHTALNKTKGHGRDPIPS